MRGLDFTSWQSLLATVAGLALVALIGVGIRLLVMMTVQQRRERANRQINERLKSLIAAYKTLGGSFTGDLSVDPRHLRDLQKAATQDGVGSDGTAIDLSEGSATSSDRTRRIRDAVEGALSDIILLGTEEQVRLASHAARELGNGQPVHTQALVVSLRDFIREALDLAPIPWDVPIPPQGPARPSSSKQGNKDDRGNERGGKQGGGAGAAGGMGAGGLGLGVGLGATSHGGESHDRDS